MRIFNNLFSKIMGGYLALLLAILLSLLTILPNNLEDYFFQSKGKELLKKARMLRKLILFEEYEEINGYLGSLEGVLDSTIIVLNQDGKILNQGRRMRGMMRRDGKVRGIKRLSRKVMGRGINFKKEVKRVLSGEQRIFHGQSPILNQAIIGVGIPLNNSNKEVLFLISPLRGLQQTASKVKNLTLKVALVATIIALVLGYFISQGISRPLKEMKRKAKIMAKGEFHLKIDRVSNDEIGDLAKTFNYLAAELGKLDEMRRLFVANTSHELKTPLTSIRGYLEAMLDGVVEDKELEEDYLRRVLSETNINP